MNDTLKKIFLIDENDIDLILINYKDKINNILNITKNDYKIYRETILFKQIELFYYYTVNNLLGKFSNSKLIKSISINPYYMDIFTIYDCNDEIYLNIEKEINKTKYNYEEILLKYQVIHRKENMPYILYPNNNKYYIELLKYINNPIHNIKSRGECEIVIIDTKNYRNYLSKIKYKFIKFQQLLKKEYNKKDLPKLDDNIFNLILYGDGNKYKDNELNINNLTMEDLINNKYSQKKINKIFNKKAIKNPIKEEVEKIIKNNNDINAKNNNDNSIEYINIINDKIEEISLNDNKNINYRLRYTILFFIIIFILYLFFKFKKSLHKIFINNL